MSFAAATGFETGLAFGAASLASIGPNNLMLIREGLLRGRVLLVASLVFVSYVGLIVVAFVLSGSIGSLDPGVRSALSWLGLTALAWFAVQSFRAASFDGRRADERSGPVESRRSCLARVMGVLWMNPLTYVELVLVPAALCQSFTADGARLDFVMALIMMAALACYGYTLGGRFIASVLHSRASLRVFDLASGIVLSGVAASVAVGLVGGAVP